MSNETLDVLHTKICRIYCEFLVKQHNQPISGQNVKTGTMGSLSQLNNGFVMITFDIILAITNHLNILSCADLKDFYVS